ncbi:predicted protein [Histoplasma mississippiense (nom. inval.)]|uniref:predicted protein n=1 Tax=Ajellomyces capsulatus (strain NAm1 / WU24) TaxID=2059318 RepID=UPI000157CFEF|nr:predicted protein [Histoplasma mississippiense (nom. inval.)]EDN11423.1 predicted protein [Histoplasma mississippiense (nom. inval.)]
MPTLQRPSSTSGDQIRVMDGWVVAKWQWVGGTRQQGGREEKRKGMDEGKGRKGNKDAEGSARPNRSALDHTRTALRNHY